LARDADALAIVKDAFGPSSPDISAVYARAAIPARYALEREQWREAAALPDPAASKFPYIEAMTLFARAVGAARSGDSTTAEKDAARLAAIADALKTANNDYWATEVQAQRRSAAAWIAFAVGKRDEAVGLMRSAADIEDSSEKSGISPGRIVPARELLQAAAAAGNRDKARYYFGRIVEMANAGSDRPALAKTRTYLAAN
jgi:hypothetical protein